MNEDVHKQHFGVAILRLSLSAISLWVSSSLGLPCVVIQLKIWASSCLILPCISMTTLGAKRQTDRERTQKQQRFMHFFGDHSSTNWRGRSLLFFSFLWPLPTFQTRSCLVAKLCPTLWLHELQHAWLHCPLLSLRVCSYLCQLSRWCHQPSHSLLLPSPHAFNLSFNLLTVHSGLFQWVGFSHQVAKVLELQL